jgi:DNA-binding MarR family transcriptional regulator
MAWTVPRMDDLESDAWLGLVTMLELVPPSLDAQLQRDARLTHFEFMVLSLLRFAPLSTLQAKQLAAETNATLPRLSHVVSRLAERGLVERLPCPGDKRATNVHLTDEGRRAVIRAMSGHVDHVRRLVLDRLSREELGALASISTKINAVLSPNDRMLRPSPDAPRTDEEESVSGPTTP